ncbi:telomere length regulation protein-domain-containing protein [Powellomyces hirtus]|nr:telomere length regulation protein-domain-containing protein [Powellomyces hirtus]
MMGMSRDFAQTEEAKHLLSECLTDLHSHLRTCTTATSIKEALAEPLVYLLHSQPALRNLAKNSTQPPRRETSRFFHRLPPTSDTEYCQLFLHHFIQPHYELLLKDVAPNWLPAFAKAEKRILFDAYFTITPDAEVLKAFPMLKSIPALSLRYLIGAVSWNAPKYVLETVLHLIQNVLTTCTVVDLVNSVASDSKSQSEMDAVEWEQLASLLCFIPDKVANQRAVTTPRFFEGRPFMAHIARNIAAALQGPGTHDDSSVIPDRLALFVGKMVRLGYTDSLIDVWLPSIITTTLTRPPAWNDLFPHFSSSEFEKLFVVSITRVASATSSSTQGCEALWNWIGQRAMERLQTMEVVFHKCLFQAVYGVEILRLVVGLMARYPTSSPLSMRNWFKAVVDTWGDATFVNHASHEQHLHLTTILLLCLHHLSADDMSSRDGFSFSVLPNLQPYLDSTDLRIRRLGMVTAECFSKKLDTNVTLDFELEEDEESAFLRSLMGPEVSRSAGEQGLGQGTGGHEHGEATHLEDSVEAESEDEDPDEVMPSARESDSDDSDDDDDLEPYDMPETANAEKDAERTAARRPLYIQECLEGLQSHDDPDRIQVCLERVVPLVKSTPVETLEEISDSLCSTLLYLNDTYELPGFAEQRIEGITAIITRVPRASMKLLIGNFYDRQIGFPKRLDVLQCIAKAAVAMRTGEKASLTTSNPSTHVSQELQVAKSKKDPRFRPRPNEFAPHAWTVLRLLIGGFEYRNVTSTVFSGAHGRILLGKLITTAGVVVHCAGNTLESRQIARQYFDFIWSLRLIDDINTTTNTSLGSLRHSILFGISVIFASMPTFLLNEEFGNPAFSSTSASEVNYVQAWLLDILASDPKPETRQLAVSVLKQTETLYAEQRATLLGSAGL